MLANAFFLALVAWPTVLILAALANMLVWGKFHWAEPFVMAPLAGIVIGAAHWWAFQPVSGGAAGFFHALVVLMSHGAFGVMRLGGMFHDSATFFWWSAGCTLGATILAAALDHAASAVGPRGVGAVLLGILLFLLKAPFCLVHTAIGVLIFIVGAIQAAISSGNHAGLAGGATWEEWSAGSTSTWATTVGATFHCWQGPVANVFDHERHHTRQCIYFHDWMIPMWVIGEIGHLVTGRNDGNPLENVPYQIQ